MKKKVLICLGYLELGGAEKQAIYLIKYLHQHANFKVYVVGFKNPKGRVAKILQEFQVPFEMIELKLYKRNKALFLDCIKLWFLLRRIKPEVIIPYTYWPNVLCSLIWKFTSAKKCFWNQRDEGRGITGRHFEKYALKNVSTIISNSTEGRNFLSDKFGLKKSYVKIIHNGVQLDKPQFSQSQWREKLTIDESYFVATMVANLHFHKDHATLIKAWRLVVDEGKNFNPILLLAGRLDDRYSPLKALVEELHLQSYVKFLGAVEDIAGLLSITNIGAFSSKKEGLPNGILECMAAGIPVVATNITGAREALGNDYNYLAEPDDPRDFSEKIMDFYDNPILCKEVGARNQKIILEKFNMSKMLNGYLSIINS